MRVKRFFKENISGFSFASLCIFALCLFVKILAVTVTPFADFFNRFISSIVRAVLAYITGIFPFSLAETFIICSLPLAVILTVFVLRRLGKSDRPWRVFFNLFSAGFCIISVFFVSFSIAYDCTPLEDRIGIDREISDREIFEAGCIAIDEILEIQKETDFVYGADGATLMPYSFDTMSEKLNEAYEKLYGEYGFLAPLNVRVKPVALSKPLTYTHISGVYTFFTGEANVNINYPPYVTVFTAAHEMAHQRGIAPEDEASFIAFLACISSDDPYIRYCGYAEILEYFSASLSGEMAVALAALYPKELLLEYRAYNLMFTEYRDSSAAKVSNSVNDTYLKVHGESEGIKSYDLVTELAAAYILKNTK